MKTIEEKAKAYDEIIERAKTMLAAAEVMYGKENNSSQLITDIIPELRESEDERIRKKLIGIFTNQSLCDVYNLKSEDVLAYLERQKEQKPNPLCGSMEEYYREAYYADQPQKEQKPAEVEQNPLVRMLKDKKAITEDIRNGIPTKTIEKERNVKFATPVDVNHTEWSEEDEKTYNLLLNHFRQAFERRTTSLTREEIEKIYYFLKDRRLKKGQIICVDVNRIQEYLPRITWKPSEEQLKELNFARLGRTPNVVHEHLDSLYNDLLKLK